MKKLVIVFSLGSTLLLAPSSKAFNSYKNSFNSRYGTTGTRLDTCLTCHTTASNVGPLNPYGDALLGRLNAGDPIATALANIESLDSDGDTYSNLVEINARYFPGNPNDHPVPSEPVIGVSPTMLPFGNVRRNTAAVLSVTLTNTGNATLSVTALTVTGSAEFGLTNAPALPWNLPPGSGAQVGVRYAPVNIGSDAGNLAVASSDPAHPVVNVTLSGAGIAPVITVNPAALDFGSLTLGLTTNRAVTLGNTGNAPCQISALTKTGSTDFSFGDGAPVPPFAINPGSSVVVPLAYTPSDVGPDDGNLAVSNDDEINPIINIPLTGAGDPIPTAPNLAANPASLPFGNIRVGQAATLDTIVGNSGTATGIVTSLTVSGADFALGGGAPATPFPVAPGANVAIPVVFMPSAVAPRAGQLVLATTDPNHPTINVALSGAGVLPQLAVTPVAVDFNTVMVGNAVTRSITIANAGNTSLTVTSIVLTASAEFTFAAGTPLPPFNIPANASTNVLVRFAPMDEGAEAGSVVIGGDDPVTPLVTVTLVGRGELPSPVPVVGVNPAVLAFGATRTGTTRHLSFTVSNTGGAEAHLGTPVISGSADFTTSQPAFDLAPGATQDVSVQYAPADVGADSGTLSFTSNDPSNAVLQVALSGTGVAPALTLTPAVVDFGAVQTNASLTRLLTLVNAGTDAAQVSALTVTGSVAFALDESAPLPPFSVAAGAMVDVPVRFTPSSVGAHNGALVVSSDDPAHPQLQAALSGTGVSGAAAVDVDIAKFKPDKKHKLGASQPVAIAVWLIYRGSNSVTRTVTVVGIQGGAEVYREAQALTLGVEGGRQRFEWPTYRPTKEGLIEWTATVADEDPDADIATATTIVTSHKKKSDDDDHDR